MEDIWLKKRINDVEQYIELQNKISVYACCLAEHILNLEHGNEFSPTIATRYSNQETTGFFSFAEWDVDIFHEFQSPDSLLIKTTNIIMGSRNQITHCSIVRCERFSRYDYVLMMLSEPPRHNWKEDGF